VRIAVVTVSRSVHVRVYVEYLLRRGHDLVVFTNGPTYSDLDVPTVDLRPFGDRRFRLPRSFIRSLRKRRLCRGLRTGRFDVVSAQMVLMEALDAVECSRAPVVLSFHGSDVHRRNELPNGLADEFDERLPNAVKRAAAVHAVSKHMADELADLGTPREKLAVFQYGIEMERFVPAHDAPRERRIVSNRAFKPFYRVNLLLQALPVVLAEFPDVRLAVYGEGPEEQRLRDMAADLGIASVVEFAGQAPPEAIAADLGRSMVWASMSESDGTPLSLLEAMAAGAYPVVADIPTLHEWIVPPHGRFVAPDAFDVARGLIDGLRAAETGAHIAPNRAIVAERGQREANLERYETLLADVAAGRAIET
jgi:L-malate glycosyltransferase